MERSKEIVVSKKGILFIIYSKIFLNKLGVIVKDEWLKPHNYIKM